MQSDEKSSSHPSLAPNVAAMYVLPGKQTTPALRQKIVKKGDVAVGETIVDHAQACTTCDRYGFKHQRAKQQEQNSPWNLIVSGICDFEFLKTADMFYKAREPN